MMLLAIDTSASLCAAAVHDGESELARQVLDLGKGHAEHLMAVIDDALAKAGKTYQDLDRIAVAVGPGSFTGIRVGVATARGLALALDIPVIGISNLEAVAAETRATHAQRAIMSAFSSAQGMVQLAIYDPLGELVHGPVVTTADNATALAVNYGAVVSGSAATTITTLNTTLVDAGQAVTADIAVYARLALARTESEGRPKPLYLREPDAKPQAGFAVPRTGR